MNAKYLKFLEGKKIVQTGRDPEGFAYLILDDNTTVYLLSDDEGNAPGSVSIFAPHSET